MPKLSLIAKFENIIRKSPINRVINLPKIQAEEWSMFATKAKSDIQLGINCPTSTPQLKELIKKVIKDPVEPPI